MNYISAGFSQDINNSEGYAGHINILKAWQVLECWKSAGGTVSGEGGEGSQITSQYCKHRYEGLTLYYTVERAIHL